MANCPRCGSPNPKLHPAMQFEGEVQPCAHPWHQGEAGSASQGLVQVMMHEVLRADFEHWLSDRGLMLQRTPFLDDEGDEPIPTYNVAPRWEHKRHAGTGNH